MCQCVCVVCQCVYQCIARDTVPRWPVSVWYASVYVWCVIVYVWCVIVYLWCVSVYVWCVSVYTRK